MDQIAVINHSTKVTTLQAALMVQACNNQIARHIAPAWKRVAIPVVFYMNEQTIPPTAQKVVIFDDADMAGALGYHTEENSRVYARVFVNPVLESGGVVLYDPNHPQNVSVASVLSHEIAEMFIDPFVNDWSEGPHIAEGGEYAKEVGDPVQGDSYTIVVYIPPYASPTTPNVAAAAMASQPVSVSNFVFPEWFDYQAPLNSRFDQCNKVRRPFTLSHGGYMVVRKGPGSEKQVFGEIPPPAWRAAAKSSPMSRTFKRCVKYGPIVVASESA